MPAVADLPALADRLRSLHDARPLVLPNVWDAASAQTFAGAGFGALATGSASVAATLGYDDHQAMPVDEAFAAVARITRVVDVPVSADLEAGYGLPPAEFVERLLDAGAVGCNLEDTDHAAGDGSLLDIDAQAAYLAAVVDAAASAGVPIVLNARVDTYARRAGATPEERFESTIDRARAYRAAGASCIYPILAADDAVGPLAAAIDAPVNALHRSGGPTLGELGALGVARITFGSGLHRVAMNAVEATATALAAGKEPT